MSTSATITPYLIPLQNQQQALSISIAGVTYQLTVTWCDPAQCWVMNIADNAGNPILSGIPLVTGADLLEQFGYLEFGGQLIAQTDNDPTAVPTFQNLGSTGNLFFVVID